MKFAAVLLLIGGFALGGPRASASFEQSQVRFFSPRDVFGVLKQKFPAMTAPERVSDNCTRLTDENKNMVGAAAPASGLPTQANPGSAFLRWYLGCLKEIVEAELIKDVPDAAGVGRYLPPAVRAKYGDTKGVLAALSWDVLSPEESAEIIRFNLESFIGPEEVLKDLKSADGYEARSKTIANFVREKGADGGTLLEGLRWVLTGVALQPEFLKY